MLGRDNPRAVIETNVAGTANLLEIARQRGVRLVFCSSTSAYGHTAVGLEPVPEDAPLAADDIYGATKASGDILTRAYVAQTGLDARRAALLVGLRAAPAHHLRGARDDQGRARRAAHHAPLRPRLHTAVRLYRRRRERRDRRRWMPGRSGPQRAFNITGGVRLEFGEIADAVRDAVPGAQVTLGEGADPEDQSHGRFDISAAARVLRWRPQIAFADGVRTYARWLAENPV